MEGWQRGGSEAVAVTVAWGQQHCEGDRQRGTVAATAPAAAAAMAMAAAVAVGLLP